MEITIEGKDNFIQIDADGAITNVPKEGTYFKIKEGSINFYATSGNRIIGFNTNKITNIEFEDEAGLSEAIEAMYDDPEEDPGP